MPLDYSTHMALEDLDAHYFKEVYLTGFTFYGSDGQPLPNAFFEEHLKNALGRLEQTTQIDVLTRVNKSEKHDFRYSDYSSFGFIQLFKKPTISVEQIRFNLPASATAQVFPKEWYRVNKAGSQINLVPTAGGINNFIFVEGGAFLPIIFSGYYAEIPQAWEIDYTSGFDQCKMPRLITQAIAKLAAMEIFIELSDLVRPLGISSQSLSVDGLSQSKGYVTPAFKSRIDQYKEDLWGPLGTGKGLIDQIIDTYGVFPFSVT